MKTRNKVLFICNGGQKPDYAPLNATYKTQPAGLANSARLVVEMLNKHDVHAMLVHVIDNNDIDRVVTTFKPNLVVIEALWVVPEKFDILKKLHPDVKWSVRLHSELPFIASEGVAMEWVKKYIEMGVLVSANSSRMQRDLQYIFNGKIGFTPNYYVPENIETKRVVDEDLINVGCFGATRLLKNQLIQAVAAIRYADKHKKKLAFHVNSVYLDASGRSIIENVRKLFAGTKHTLVEHGWYTHEEFLQVLSLMDVGMQVSLSETFNIVTADFVHMGKPVVVSDEVSWVASMSRVSSCDVDSIVKGLERAIRWSDMMGLPEYLNARALRKFSKTSKNEWLKYIKTNCK